MLKYNHFSIGLKVWLRMIGTFVNVGTILIGSTVGGVFGKALKEKHQQGLYTALGLAVTALGVNSFVKSMPQSKYPVLFIASLAIGSLIGTVLKLDERFQRLTSKLGKSDLGKGLSTAILLFCIGTLSILGPVESALNGDHTYLFTNAALDLVTSMVLASTYGFGIAIAAGVLFLWQGSIWLLASWLGGFIPADLLTEISIVGGILIFASGISILGLKDCKTLNLLPALFVPVLWFTAVGVAL